jgi:hypothetical protein
MFFVYDVYREIVGLAILILSHERVTIDGVWIGEWIY